MLLSLIGEQPIPVLLTDRALTPARHFLAHTDKTKQVAEHLQVLLPHAELLPLPDAYDLASIRQAFEQVFTPGMTFNLTSGTKPMAWAGYEVARQRGAQVVYLESEKKLSRLYRFDFASAEIYQTPTTLPGLVSLADYLQAHGLKAQDSQPLVNNQEVALKHALESLSDELLHNLKYPAFEIDFLVRRGNQVAVVEAKSGLSPHGRKRDGIDQLTTITGREHLGIYTGRIWAVAKMPGRQCRNLLKPIELKSCW